jgi:hypothetical protein
MPPDVAEPATLLPSSHSINTSHTCSNHAKKGPIFEVWLPVGPKRFLSGSVFRWDADYANQKSQTAAASCLSGNTTKLRDSYLTVDTEDADVNHLISHLACKHPRGIEFPFEWLQMELHVENALPALNEDARKLWD